MTANRDAAREPQPTFPLLPITVKTTSGRIEVENQSPITGEDALRLAVEKWPDAGLRYVRWALTGEPVGNDETIFIGQTVIVRGEVPGDA